MRVGEEKLKNMREKMKKKILINFFILYYI